MDFLRRLFNHQTSSPDLSSEKETVPFPVSEPARHLRYGQTSDGGKMRAVNQDACMSFASFEGNAESFGLFIVADGMGGHQQGEKAASLTVRAIAQHITNRIYLPMLTDKDEDHSFSLPETLYDAAQQANDVVTEQASDSGTTLTAAVIYGDLAYIIHVGDSRAYLIDDFEMEQLTRDHSLVQRLVELDQLTPEQAAEHPHRNVLYRAVGQSDHLEIDSTVIHPPPAAKLLLCSDGLWNVVPKETVLDIIAANPDPQTACDKLVAAANEGGGPDNITVALIRVTDPPPRAKAEHGAVKVTLAEGGFLGRLKGLFS